MPDFVTDIFLEEGWITETDKFEKEAICMKDVYDQLEKYCREHPEIETAMKALKQYEAVLSLLNSPRVIYYTENAATHRGEYKYVQKAFQAKGSPVTTTAIFINADGTETRVYKRPD